MKYIESTPLPDGTYDHTEVRAAYYGFFSVSRMDSMGIWVDSPNPAWYPESRYRTQVPDTYGIHESSSTLREVKGDAGPAVAEMLLDRIKELEDALRSALGHMPYNYTKREFIKLLNKEPK